MSAAILRVDVEHADSVLLRAAQRAEIAARYRDPAREPGRLSSEDFSAFYLAYVDGMPAGCGGVMCLGDESADAATGSDGGAFPAGFTDAAEVKRMYVSPAYRGTGIAPQLLAEIESFAREQGRTRLVLETGTGQPDAMRFYEREGFSRIPNFGPYETEELSVCYAKLL
ncbi:GNAT family N-acetyltransferase [Ruicaihuangia caeni]|uniref:GNAT family N-acetyltransferase n=1 Tax=Ruicaihuangia caeni TaxID=3042517 RepID=A0AAW6T8H3_9MICO|nr:GNAT family N-acetyltransferase [Klugiella sp. YN-L-19]MDI2098395.1 GNAT family N-acetyltransferase [Klugiella sp. YN-L-19]